MVRSTVEQEQECGEDHDFLKIYAVRGLEVAPSRAIARLHHHRAVRAPRVERVRRAPRKTRRTIATTNPQAPPALPKISASERARPGFSQGFHERARSGSKRGARRPTNFRHSMISAKSIRSERRRAILAHDCAERLRCNQATVREKPSS